MSTKQPTFLAYEKELKEDFSQAFTRALAQMGEDAKYIDWFAGNSEITDASKQESSKAA